MTHTPGSIDGSIAPVVRASLLSFARVAPLYLRDPIDFFEAVHARFGPTVMFGRRSGWLGRSAHALVITSDPALVRQVLLDRHCRSSALTLQGPKGSAQRRLRRSLFRMHGEEHHEQRMLIGPALQKRAVASYHGVMLRGVESVLGRWKAGEVRDVAPDLKSMARMVASLALFGHQDAAESARIGELAEDWAGDSWRPLPHLRRGPAYRKMLEKAERLERAILEVIERKRGEGLPDGDLLTRLIRANAGDAGLTDVQLVGHANILFLAAHETTAYSLIWTLYLLAQHPEVASRVCAEIEAVLGDAPPRAEQLEELELLDRVIRESLRVVPIVPYGARVAMANLALPELHLPRKSRVLIPYHVMHHDPTIFPQPNRFDPDRWIDFEPPPYAYLPFSAGPHVCIGIAFAQHTMRLTLAMILQRFRFSVVPGSRIDRRVTVTVAARRGLPMRLLPLDGQFERVPVSGDVSRMVDLGDGSAA